MSEPRTTLEALDQTARSEAIGIDRNILCTAPAGSGKTELLVQRALACLAASRSPEETLAITFTNKAGAEIRERLMLALEAAEGPPPETDHKLLTWKLGRAVLERDQAMGWGLRLNPGRIRAMTIDALNSFLASQAPVVSGMGGGVGVLDRPEGAYRDAILSLFGEVDDRPADDPLRQAMFAVLRFGRNRLEDLVPILSGMLRTREQWLPLIAGGNDIEGKTRELLDPIIQSRLDLVARLIRLPLRNQIAAAACSANRFDLDEWPAANTDRVASWRTLTNLLTTDKGAVRKQLTVKDGFPPKAPYTEEMKRCLKELQELPDLDGLGMALSAVTALPALSDADAVEVFGRQVRMVLLRLAAHLKLAFMRAGGLDFPEISRRALDALSDEHAECTPLLQRLDYQIRHILVDESQDTSRGQIALLKALTSGWSPGDGRSLFIVGDPKQSIYGFREAEVSLLLHMMEQRSFNGLPLHCIRLTRNFRSDERVVDWCNTVFGKVFPTTDDPYSGGVRHEACIAARGDLSGTVKSHWFRGEPHREEAERVVEVIKAAQAEKPTASIAILARYRAHFRETLAALRRHGIRYRCKDIDPLGDTPAVRDIVGLTRALWHEQDRIAWATLLRAPFVGLSYADFLVVTRGRTSGSLLQAIRETAVSADLTADGRARLAKLLSCLDDSLEDRDLISDLGAWVEAMWHSLGGPGCLTRDEAEDVRQAFRLLRSHTEGGRLTDLQGFIDGLDKLYASGGSGGVEIMTMHGSKGLEFDVVIMVGLWRGQRKPDKPLLAFRNTAHGMLMVPAGGPSASEGHERLFSMVNGLNNDAAKKELLRLLYVGCTRAVRELHLMCAVTDKGAPLPGSLVQALWPALAQELAGATVDPAAGKPVDGDTRCPSSPRLPTTWASPTVSDCYVPPVIRVLLPSEMTVREDPTKIDKSEGVFERLVGTAFHETVSYLLDRDEIGRFETLKERISVPMRAGLRRRGMPAPRVDDAVSTVLRLIGRMKHSPHGQWILHKREQAGNEFRVAGYLSGEWVSGSIDRWFRDADQLWVIDYKTGGENLGEPELQRYIDNATERYRPQVTRYAEMLGEINRCDAKKGLYFASIGKLIEV